MDAETRETVEETRLSLEKRFYRKLSRYKTATGCIEWTAATNGRYGIIRSSHKPFKWLLAHRVAYELQCGPIPFGMDCMHKCDNPLCVNGEHLTIGTAKDNVQDMVKKGRVRKSQFSDSDLERIRDMTMFGVPQRAICGTFGVSRPLISLLLSGKVSTRITT